MLIDIFREIDVAAVSDWQRAGSVRDWRLRTQRDRFGARRLSNLTCKDLKITLDCTIYHCCDFNVVVVVVVVVVLSVCCFLGTYAT